MTSTNPSTWSFAKFQVKIKTFFEYSNPRIFSNGAGDVIALSAIADAKGNHHLKGLHCLPERYIGTLMLYSINNNSNGFNQQALLSMLLGISL